MRHIIDGSSQASKDKMREKYDNSTAEFLKENFSNNVKNILFGGSRDFADNNDTDDITAKALCDNTFAVFMLKESKDQHAHPFIGKVSSLRVEHYRVESSPHTQGDNYLLTQRVSNDASTPLDQLKIVCKLDMHTEFTNKLVINLNKFGSYWFFVSLFLNRQY
ncbi:hypothetical protein J3Q64DRAFT_1881846 [Phycomyces blakesleeanus]|uniref:Uncharacterized protein n=1 Tax=Phycomyces blakesleeanus TaxID=4837 RepID=A0ABR3B2U7_PHYBL